MIQYSISGIPYIPINEDSMLIFSDLGYNNVYKRFTYSGNVITSFKYGDEIRKTKRRIGFILGLTLSKLPSEAKKIPFPSLETRSTIGKVIRKYLNEEKELPKNKIKDVEKELAEVEMELA
jgi:hypothetical protein